MKNLAAILTLLFILTGPLLAQEEEFQVLISGNIHVSYGYGATISDANCTALSLQKILGESYDENGEYHLGLVRQDEQLALLMFCPQTLTEETLNSLSELAAQFQSVAFPDQPLLVIAVDGTTDEEYTVYESYLKEVSQEDFDSLSTDAVNL